MNVSISVVSDKTILVNKALADAAGGKAIRVKAVKGGRYLLAENGSGVAPENITVKRVGKNLHVALEGSDPDQPELIIEDFFGSNGQLIGLGEDGQYHEYIAADGDSDSAAAFLMDGVSSPLALGYPQIVGFGEGLVVAGGGMLPWALAGIGSLVGGAIVEHNKGGDNKVVDTTAPENKGIGSIVDDKGPIKGPVGNGGVTDDGRPTLSGSGQEPGDTVQVIDNGKVIGEVIVDGGGNWTFTPEKDLGDGEHVLEIIVKDPSGNSSDPSEEIVIIIDGTAPTKPGIDSVIDDQGPVTGAITNGGQTDDTQPTLSGKGDAGDTVTIIDNGKVIGEVQVGDDGRWTFTPGVPLAEGEHVFEVVVTDPAGNSSKPSDEFVVIVDTTAPSKPDVGGVIDDQGPITGPVGNGGITDDSQPTLNGKGDAGDTVTIIDNGKVVGEVQVDDEGNWSFTPEAPLEEGEHSFEVVVTDPSGNSSGPSDEFVIIVDTTPPAKPGINEIIDDQGAVTGPVVNGGLTDDNQPTLSGKGDAGDTVTIIDNGKVIGEVPVGEDGSWSFTPEAPLSEGEHVFEVVITDPAGNASEPSDDYVVIVDTVPPVNGGIGNIVDDQGSITGPVGNGGATDDSQPTLSGKGDAGDTVTIIDNGKVVGEVQVGDDGNWSFTPEAPLVEGEHSFEVVVTDPAGNSSGPSDEFVIIVDTTPPTNGGIESIIDDSGDVTGPVSNGGSTDDNTPTLSGKGDAGDTVTISDNGKVIGDVLVGEDGTWSFTPDPLDDGEHAFEIVVTDPAGNSSGPSGEYVITIDTDVPGKPVIESVYDDQGDYKGPLNSGDITDDNKPVFSGTAEPNTTVILKDKGVEIGRAPVGADGKWSFEPTEALPFGTHNVTAESVNAAGTVSEPSDGFAFELSTPDSPPAPAITSVVDDVGSITGNIQKNAVTDDARPTINGTAQVGTTVSIYIDGALAGVAEVAANGDWSFTPSVDLANGLHNITAKATNSAGNSSPETGKYPINVDTVQPDKPNPGDASLWDNEGNVTGVISNGTDTDDRTPTFKGKAEPNGTVIIYDNGTEIGRVPTDAAGDWTFTPSPELELGEHSFDYQVMDKAGNVSDKSDAISFEVIDGGVEIRITGAIDDAGSVTGVISANGVTDDTTPTLQGKATAGGTVKVYEGSVLLGETVVDGEGNWSFTPTTPLSEGAHSLTATVTTEATGESEASSAFDFTIDTILPNKPLIESISDDVGSIQGKLVNGQDTDDTTPTLAGKAEAGSTVRIYDNGSLLSSVVADANGSWNYTASPPLLNGKHEFTVTAVDKAGNVSEKSDAFSINIDTIVPDKPVILSAYDDQGGEQGALLSGAITDDSKPVFSGTAEPNTTVVVFNHGEKIGSAAVDADGNWSFEPTTPLILGNHAITVEAVDKAGNASKPSDRFELEIVSDVTPAVPAITSVVDDFGSITGNIQKNAVTDDANPTINGTAEAGVTVSIYIDGVLSGSVLVGANGEWSHTPTVGLVDGLHNITAKASNGAGNSSAETGKYPIVVDTTPAGKPVPGDAALLDNEGQVQGPITNGTVTDDSTPTFEGKGEPNGTVIIYDNGTEIGRVPSDNAGNWSFTPSPALADGNHSLNYEVVDKAGNVSDKSDAIDFVVNTGDVKVTIEGATDDAGSVTGAISKNGVTDDTTPTLHGKGALGGTVKVYEGGVLLGETLVDGEGNWSFTPTVPLSEGAHSLTATVTTVAHGESEPSSAFDFSIDITQPNKPLIESISDDVGSIQGKLANGQDTDDTTPTLAGKAEGGSTVRIYDNGSLLASVVADANGSWNYTASPPLLNGKHEFTVTAVDKAGNVSEKSDAFTINIDTAMPDKPVILGAYDDQGEVHGALQSGGITDDAKPVFNGTAEPNTTVVIMDKGVEIGRAPVGADGKWSFEPTTPLTLGNHAITVEAVDKAGNTSKPSDRFDLELVSDVTPAEPAITSVVDDFGSITGNIQKNAVTDDARPTINGTAEPGMTVSVYIDGALAGTAVVAANGEWSFTPSVDLSEGLHNITAKATNGVGNSSTETGKYPIVVDTTAPGKPGADDAVLHDDEGNVQGPITNGTVTDDATPTFEGKGEPNGTVIIYDNGTEIGRVPSDNAGNWSFTPSPALEDGNHSLNYIVVDQAGNVGPKSDAIDFVVNTVDVEVTIDGATDDAGSVIGNISKNGVTDDVTPTLHGKGALGGTVKVYEGGVLLGETLVDGEGNWSFTPTVPLSEGAHSLTATVTTVAHGESEPSSAFDFSIDITQPNKPLIESITDDVGASQSQLVNGQDTDDTTPTLAGKAEAGSTVRILDNGSLLGSVVADANGNWNFTPPTPLINGKHEFTVTAVDKAGNVSEPSDAFAINIDTIAPDQPVILGAYDDEGDVQGSLLSGGITDDAKPVFNGTAEPNTTVVVKDKGVEIGRAPVGADGTWSFEPTTPLATGKHEITVEAVDKAGNTSKPSERFDLETIPGGAPPAPAITSVVDDVGSITGNIQKNAVTDDARPTINGTAQPGATVTIYVDKVEVGTVVASASGEWSFTPSDDLANGLRNITATATNGVGNISPETGDYPINVDTVKPDKPGADDAQLLDDEGKVQGPITNGTVTDDTTPTFEGKGEPNGTVIIYDNGTEIGRVPSDSAGNWSFTPSPALEKGPHSFNYEVVDEAGNVSPKSDAISFEVDNSSVQVTIEGATDDAGSVTGEIGKNGVTDDATPTLHGKGTIGGTVKVYEGSVLLGETLVDGQGNWRFTPSAPLSEGAHGLSATVTTGVNGESDRSTAFEFTVDLTPPSVPTLDAIYDDVGSKQANLSKGEHTDDATPTLSGKADAGSTVHIYDNGSLLGKVTADAAGNWGFTPSPPLLNGDHNFTVAASDKAGNLSQPSEAFDIVIDTVAPDAPVIETVYDDQGSKTGNLNPGDKTDDAKPTVSGRAEAHSTVIIKDDGVEIGRVVADVDGKWTFETPSLKDGEHKLTAEAVDAAGNGSPSSNEFGFLVDGAVPTTPKITNIRDDAGEYTGILQNGGTTDDSTPTINGNGVAGETIEIRMDGVTIGTAVVAANNRWTFTPTTAVADGVHVFTAVAVSGGGAESGASNSFQIRVDTVAPDSPIIDRVHDNAGSWTGNLENGQHTDDRTPTFFGKAEANSTIVVFDNGDEVGFAAVDADGNWTYSAESLSLGEHRFVFQSFDVAGNTSKDSEAWTVVVGAASRSLDKGGDSEATLSVQDLLADDQGELFSAQADAKEPMELRSLTVTDEDVLHDSWAANDSGVQVGAQWSGASAIEGVNLLDQQLHG